MRILLKIAAKLWSQHRHLVTLLGARPFPGIWRRQSQNCRTVRVAAPPQQRKTIEILVCTGMSMFALVQRLVHRTQEKVYIRQCLKTFHYSAKASNLGKYLGKLFGLIWPKAGGVVYFSCFTSALIKSLFIQSGRPQLFTIRRKSKTLSYLDIVWCSMNRRQQTFLAKNLDLPPRQGNLQRNIFTGLNKTSLY
jgi:hypothetical protein